MYSLLIEKDVCDSRNVSVKLQSFYVCLGDLFICSVRVFSFFSYFVLSVLQYFPFPHVSLLVIKLTINYLLIFRGMLEKMLRIQLVTNLESSFPLALNVEMQPVNLNVSIILAAVVLVGLYAVIITEVRSYFFFFQYFKNKVPVKIHNWLNMYWRYFSELRILKLILFSLWCTLWHISQS